MNVQKNVRLLELYTICTNMIFIVPVVVPYYRDVIGLSFQDFLIGEAVFAAVVMALEVPSGWLSDVWKRKHVLLLAMLTWFAGFAVLLFADSLFLAVTAQGILGISLSLTSGTNTALLYDSLLAEGREHDYTRLEGRRLGIGFYAVAAAGILGGFLYEVDPRLPVVLTMTACLPGAACALLMGEPERHRSAIRSHPLADMAGTVRYALHGHAEIGFIILFAAVLLSATKLIMWTQQPYYMALGVPESAFGMLMAVGWLLAGASSHSAHFLNDKVSNLKALTLAVIAAVGICLGAAIGPGYHGIVLLMLGGSCLFGLTAPRVDNAINKRVGSERRATILSTSSLLRQLFFIPLSIGIGWIIDHADISAGLISTAGWLGLGGLLLGLWALKRNRNAKRRNAKT